MSRRRFVDAHVHLWDVHRHPWYDFPQPGKDDHFGLGLKRPFPESFLWDDYLEEVASVDVSKWVHVTAVTGAKDVEGESAWIAELVQERRLPPYALIGSVDLQSSLTAIEATLDREMVNPAYRGIRLLTHVDYDSELTGDLLEILASRRLVYDAVAGPGVIRAAAKALARHPSLTTVLEHMGWPRGTSDRHFEEWRAEMKDLAALPNTFCKLSGFSMVAHEIDVAVYRKFFAECIRLFGSSRCMFGSNFPVDLCYSPGRDLLAVFDQVAAGYSAADAENLYCLAAERAYRL
jgi:predicted TIM-barrel fold metal-dependent hydrolase